VDSAFEGGKPSQMWRWSPVTYWVSYYILSLLDPHKITYKNDLVNFVTPQVAGLQTNFLCIGRTRLSSFWISNFDLPCRNVRRQHAPTSPLFFKSLPGTPGRGLSLPSKGTYPIGVLSLRPKAMVLGRFASHARLVTCILPSADGVRESAWVLLCLIGARAALHSSQSSV